MYFKVHFKQKKLTPKLLAFINLSVFLYPVATLLIDIRFSILKSCWSRTESWSKSPWISASCTRIGLGRPKPLWNIFQNLLFPSLKHVFFLKTCTSKFLIDTWTVIQNMEEFEGDLDGKFWSFLTKNNEIISFKIWLVSNIDASLANILS